MNMKIEIKTWLLPAALILFLMEIILFPLAVQLTYGGRRESPDHVLTYTSNKLTWDSATGINPETGAAKLSLFGSSYQNVQGENDENVVAPGTEGTNIVRLKNEAGKSITYIAVMYRMKEEKTLPVEPVLEDNAAFADTKVYPLPKGVTQDQVVRAVTGSVKSGQIQDFDITWLWEYYESSERDMADTALGNKAAWYAPDDVTAGLYIVVEEARPGGGSSGDSDDGDDSDDSSDSNDSYNPGDFGDSDSSYHSNTPDNPIDLVDINFPYNTDYHYTYPDIPQTGDSGNLMRYLVLMAISGVLLLLLLMEQRKEKQ